MEINKYKKYHKQKIEKNEIYNLRDIRKGYYGLKTLESGVITPKQLETVRRIISKITKRTGNVFVNIYCSHPLTKKPLLSRMGKGSGGIDSWISYIKKGKILIEINGVSKKLIYLAFRLVQYRISIKMNIIKREVIDV
jgi:large subunit ribosomal protein L16